MHTVHSVHYTSYSGQRTLYTVYFINYTVNNVHCTVDNVHYTQYTAYTHCLQHSFCTHEHAYTRLHTPTHACASRAY